MIRNTQQKVDWEKYSENWEKIFRREKCIHGISFNEPCKFCKPPVEKNPYEKFWSKET